MKKDTVPVPGPEFRALSAWQICRANPDPVPPDGNGRRRYQRPSAGYRCRACYSLWTAPHKNDRYPDPGRFSTAVYWLQKEPAAAFPAEIHNRRLRPVSADGKNRP